MFHRILFIIYILMILTVIFIERKSPTEALLWVFIMICLPYAGTYSLSCFWKYSGSGGRENQAYDPGSEGKLFSGSCYKLFLRTASGIWI